MSKNCILKTMKNKEEISNAESQAHAQLVSIIEMVKALDGEDRDQAQQTIAEDPLSIEVRSGWCANASEMAAEEFCILLCTGGPACRIVGDIRDGEAARPRLEYQDWGTPWTEFITTGDDNAALLAYCQQFYFES